jgi:hypothetical protein
MEVAGAHVEHRLRRGGSQHRLDVHAMAVRRRIKTQAVSEIARELVGDGAIAREAGERVGRRTCDRQNAGRRNRP